MNRHLSKELARLAGLVVLSLAALGCGNDKPICGLRYDQVPSIIEDPEDLNTFWVGTVGVDELEVFGVNAAHDTLVQAHFNDFSDYQVQLADRLVWEGYPACEVYTSRPVTSGDPIPLSVIRVTVGGLAGGDLVLEPDEFDHLPTDLLPLRGFEAEMVTVDVESADGEPDFPSFQAEIAAPIQPVITRVGEVSPFDLAQSPSIGIEVARLEDLEIHWAPSGADYVEIKISPGSGASLPYGKMRCITFDDGCLTVPAAALAQLALDEATNFIFGMENHFFVLHSIKDGSSTKAAVTINTSSSIEGYVLR